MTADTQIRVIGSPAAVAAMAELIRQAPQWEVVRESTAQARRAELARLYIEVREVPDAG